MWFNTEAEEFKPKEYCSK